MIVVGTSIWIDLFRFWSDPTIRSLRAPAEPLLVHDFVVGELMLGNFRDRSRPFLWLRAFRKAPLIGVEEARNLIEGHALHGTGIGYVDVHLLASTLLVDGGKLWTRDKRLAAVAERLGVRAGVE